MSAVVVWRRQRLGCRDHSDKKTTAIQTLMHRHSQPEKNSFRHIKPVFIMQKVCQATVKLLCSADNTRSSVQYSL